MDMNAAGYEALGENREQGCCTTRRRAYAMLGVGTTLVAFGLVFGLYIPHYVNDAVVDSATVCGKSSDNYDDWQNNWQSDAAAKYTSFYAYDLQNPEDWLQGDTAVLYEKGPWVSRERDTMLNVEFSSGDKTVTYTKMEQFDFQQSLSCAGCDLHTPLVQMNAAYITALVEAGSEGAAFLTTVCSVEQITLTVEALFNATLAAELDVCGTQFPDFDAHCSCCDVLGHPDTLCTRVLDRSLTFGVVQSQFLKPMIGHDGGYPDLMSELVVNKTWTDIAFGYPNSLVGYLAGSQSPYDDLLVQAEYTDQVRRACADACASGTCEGYAPAADALDDDIKFLAEISCEPFNSVIELTATVLDGADNATCAMDGLDPAETPCCLYGGYNSGLGTALMGFGCLVEVTGQVSDRNIYNAQAQADWTVDPEALLWEEYTGCGDINDVTSQMQYESEDVFPLWTGYDSWPTCEKLLGFPANADYIGEVRGQQGTQVPPNGISASFFSSDLSAADAVQNSSYLMYVTEVYRPLPIYFNYHTEVEGIKTNRYRVSDQLLDGTPEMLSEGVGFPVDGVADLTYAYGLPAYVSRPAFMLGNESLILQTDNSDLDAADGGGIQMFKTYEYTSGKAQPLDAPVEITAETIQDDWDWYDTYLDIEPASGKTLQAHKRLMASFSLFTCDPTDYTSMSLCFLFPTPDGECYGTAGAALDTAYPCSVANYFTPNVKGHKIVPQYWEDESGLLTSDQADDIKDAGVYRQAAHILLVVATTLGVVCMGLGGWFVRQERKRQPTIQV